MFCPSANPPIAVFKMGTPTSDAPDRTYAISVPTKLTRALKPMTMVKGIGPNLEL